MRELRSLDLAEEALQEAHLAAVQQWERPPENPAGWLLTVARRRARDRLRREATLARKLPLLVVEEETEGPETPPGEDGDDDADMTTLADERLRLVFLACHPALPPEAQVALTLRYVAGLTTDEIARLFLVSGPTMAARLTRATHKLVQAGIPFRVPSEADLPARLASALAVAYLVFTEGYAPTSGSRAVREELCAEAIRLGHLLSELMPDEPEVGALLALMRLQHARRDARVHTGRLVPLAEQDRGCWKDAEIAEGLDVLAIACGHGRPGPYVFQALIAAEHTSPRRDWRTIAALYAQLERLLPSPVVRLNRAVAVAEADGPAAGLRLLEGLEARLPRGHQLPTARAELLVRLVRPEAALACFDEAVALAANEATRAHLIARRAAVADPANV